MFPSKVRSKLAIAALVPIVVATVALVSTPQVALGARPVPVVLSFTASKTSVPNTGGKVVFKASFKYASSCEFTVTPSLTGFPRSFSCSDLVTRTVTLRANDTGNPITYSFGMIVKNSAGSTAAANLVVTEGAAPPLPVPVVTSFTASRTSVPNTGANVVLKAELKYASSCEITVSPRLTGFPSSSSCSSDLVTRSVVLRANDSGDPITYTFGLIVKNSAGSTAATNVVVTEGAAPPPISFTPPPPGTPTTVVFAPEGVFVADDPLVVTVTNNSTTTQVISSAAISTVGDSADFILIRNNCASITPHADCSLAIQFQPTGAGTRTSAMNIVDASWGTAGTTLQLQLRGTGVWAAATVSNRNIRNNVLSFPTSQVLLTPSAPQSVTVTNVGSVPLYISGIGLTGGESPDFDAPAAPLEPGTCINQLMVPPSYPLIVSVGHSCTFSVIFDPSGTGTRTSNVVVADNTLGAQTQLGLEGTGIEKSA